ncbi:MULTISPECIES: GTPase Era [unclassified Mycoplasma]
MKVCTISIVGRPNVGKSTLLNAIIGYDLAIVTNVAQTTRNQIKGIYTDENYQLIFTDTPGIHKATHLFNEKLNKASYDSLEDVDLVLFLQPGNEEIGKGDKFIIEKIKNIKNKVAVITKLDLIDNDIASQKAEQLKQLGFEIVVGVGQNIDPSYKHLLDLIKHEFADRLQDQEPFYDPEEFTDISMRFIAKEVIRETALKYLKQELPHSIAVVIDSFEEKEDKPYVIHATIFVKKDSQKGIVLGKGGQMIKNISMQSRKKLAVLFDHAIYLETRVKVSEDWVDKEDKITQMGY